MRATGRFHSDGVTRSTGLGAGVRQPELAGQRPALASVSRAGTDGVAHVARLLERGLRDVTGKAPTTLDLDPASADGVSIAERARFGTRLLALQLGQRCDWVLFNHVGIARAQAHVPRALRRPYGVFLHGVEVWRDALHPDARRVLAEARLRISNSDFTARRTEALYPELRPVHPCPLALLDPHPPDGGDADEVTLARVRDPAALIVGRMSSAERYKGHDELIDAWPAVERDTPGAQLVVAGAGDDEARLRAKAVQRGVGEHVLFCGRVSAATLAGLFKRVRVFAMPSRGEGFGIVYLEAMRAGLPCVASTEDGAGDVVVDGETGILLSPDDRGAIVAALGSLLRDEERARRLGAAGRRRYEREFTYEAFRRRLGATLGAAFAPARASAH